MWKPSRFAFTIPLLLLSWAELQARLPITDFSRPPALPGDVQAALHLSFGTWGPPLAEANRIALDARITPDDFSVVAFLSNRSGLSILVLWGYRVSGMSWAQVAQKAGVPWDEIVVQPGRDHGPPYGKAWGYWKKHGGAPKEFVLTDPEFLGMVRVHTLMRATGRSPDEIIEGLQAGKGYHAWAGEAWRAKHDHGPKEKGEKERGHGDDEGGPPGQRGKEHGEGHGHGRGKG